jgi:Domain of unknown function DUF29
MPDSIYEHDILVWAEQQSALLARLARGERVNDAIDWPHLIEEVRDVGLAELHACESLLQQALLHLLKLHLEPEAPPVPHWRSEVVGFLGSAARRYAPSMRQRISLDGLWQLALRQIAAERGAVRRDILAVCPFTLDELLAPDADPSALAGRVAA